MEFISALNSFDTNLLLSLNGIHDLFFDKFMFAFTQIYVWIPFYISVIYIIIKQQKSDALWLILALVLCVVLSDQLSSGLIKNSVQRLRPSHEPALQGLLHIVNEYRGGKYGFVSSHAANSFGFAILSSLLFRKKGYIIAVFTWTIVNCYTRIYLGVHYPLDILGGMLVGAFSAFVIYYLLLKLKPTLIKSENNNFAVEIPIYTFLLSVTGIIVYAFI